MAEFVYYNRNPDGNKASDCVTRAISLSTNLPYSTVRQKLHYSAKLFDCDKLNVDCYSHLLEDVFKFPTIYCDGLTVNQFANTHPFGVYLVRMDGHISTIWGGKVIDIWDCRDSHITDAWRVL